MEKNSVLAVRSDKRFRIVFLILFGLIVFAMAFIFRYFVWSLLFALVCYVALKPMHDYLNRYIHKRWICTFIIVSVFTVVIMLPFFFLLSALADQTAKFYALLDPKKISTEVQKVIYGNTHVRDALQFFDISRSELLAQIIGVLKKKSDILYQRLTEMVTFSISFAMNFFFMILILVTFFSEGKRLGEKIYHILPFPRDIEQNIVNRLRDVIKILVAGNLVIMLLQGFFVAIGFLIFGINIPVLGGCLAALFSLIPVVGTAIVWVPAAIMLVLKGNYLFAILLAAWCLFSYLFLENIAKPRFFGNRLNFHPLVFFFLLIGSLGAFNLPGIIVGPILLTLFFSLWEIYSILYVESIPAKDPCAEEKTKNTDSVSS